MAREFSRAEFHDLVWIKPMTHLAKEFAMSDVALHKICRKHAIPTPPLGWWAKQQAGKKVQRTPLPAAAPGAVDRIVIAAPELRGETPGIADVREAARVRASDQSPNERLNHPIVDRTISMLRSATPSATGIVSAEGGDVIACEVGPASIDRLALVLARIVAAAKRSRNMERDDASTTALVGMGWRVLTVWECEIKDSTALEARLSAYLGIKSDGSP